MHDNIVPIKQPEWPDTIPVEWCTDDCKTARLIHRAENGAVYKTDCNRTFILDATGIREEVY